MRLELPAVVVECKGDGEPAFFQSMQAEGERTMAAPPLELVLLPCSKIRCPSTKQLVLSLELASCRQSARALLFSMR